jgi:hypothetical protein
MTKAIGILLLLLSVQWTARAQKDRISYDFEAEQLAKEAAGTILEFIGLPQDFYIVQKDVPNVVAYMKGSERYIGYNPVFIQRLRVQTETDWSAYSVLAHEIAHHLAGHTWKSGRTNPGNELVADHFSGFILQRMGASLKDAESALLSLKEIDAISDTINHPPVEARIEAVKDGWTQAHRLENKKIDPDHIDPLGDMGRFMFKCTFSGDENVYYIDDQDNIYWFNNLGKPIAIGRKVPSEDQGYLWLYEYGTNVYGVDNRGNIWSETNFNSKFKVGRVEEIPE